MKKAICLGAALLLALAYLLNLGSLYAPTNGDEMVYLHIARATQDGGAWLPLQSDLQTPQGTPMRNTKPPLLFWQAMWAGQWGWDLWRLRLPFALQTLFCAALVGYATWRIQQRPQAPIEQGQAGRAFWADAPQGGAGAGGGAWIKPLLAAALYLGFFATYRYGRPVLTSATESLFLFGFCVWALLSRGAESHLDAAGALVSSKGAAMNHELKQALLLGLMLIPALLTKSFVLAAPAALWWALLLWRERALSLALPVALRAALMAGFMTLVALAGFALWFVFDPDPASIWREFVLGENFSTKFQGGGDSLLLFWLSPLVNAGLLFPLVLGLALTCGWRALRHAAGRWRAYLARCRLAGGGSGAAPAPDLDLASPKVELFLGLWILVWLLVFSLPSQRSARYIIAVMPALAVLLALHAHRVHRVWWQLSLLLIGGATAALAYVAACLQGVFATGLGYSWFDFGAMALVLGLCLVGIGKAAWCRGLTAICALAWLVLLGQLAAPFDRDAARFGARTAAVLAGQQVWVPQNFNAQFERYQFIIQTKPRVQPLPYKASQGELPAGLMQQGAWAIVLAKPDAEPSVAGCPPCRVVDQRWVLRSRHEPREITLAQLLSPKGLQNLLVERERLVQFVAPPN